MTDFQSLSASLKGEVMVDIANGYFGARKAIDDEREFFERVESDIRLAEQRALTICAQLMALLTSEHNMEGLLYVLGVPVDFLPRVESANPWLSMKLPFAFTAEGRYKKCVLETYERMRNAFEFFLHGTLYEKKGSLEKYGKTTGFYRYMEWCTELNEHIAKVNRDHSPSQVLSVVRGMDVDKVAKQKAVGAVNSKAGCIPGEDMCLTFVPCEEFSGMVLPELPALKAKLDKRNKVSSLIKQYASEVYKSDRAKVEQLIEILKKN
ncbi:hypothetical protein ACAG65_11365 [Halodesulfovibrio aestuarii]|uniref:hypothetical protein n=1 Tax=Halodesulfovibrio aestuarii TaxID=126333 RepID=UPI00351FE363